METMNDTGKTNPAMFMIARLALAAVFIVAGAIKIWNPGAFAISIQGYRMLPYVAAVVLALYLPWLEVVCGILLVLNRMMVGSLATLLILLVVFIAALATAWSWGLKISCGCFGDTGASDVSYHWHIAGNGVLMVLAGILLWRAIRAQQRLPAR